jgi:hypothetical protein
MEITIIVLLVLAAGLLAAILIRLRQSAQGQSPALGASAEVLPAEQRPASSDAEAAGAQSNELSFRVADPAAPGRELLVEFVPSDLADLVNSKGVDRVDGSHAGANAFDALISSVPKGAALLESGMAMRVVGPPEALAGLQSGSLTLVTSAGKNLGQVRDVASGNFGSHLEVAKGGVTPALGALAVFQVMSVITGQYYLHRIDSKLTKIQKGIDTLIQGQQSELLGKVGAAARLNEHVRKDLLDGIPPSEGHHHDLNHAEQLVLASYGEAQSRVSDLLAEFQDFDPDDIWWDKSQWYEGWERVQGHGLVDVNILIYAAFVRHQNSLLSLAIEPQGDLRRAENIHERIVEDRDQMLADLKAVRPLFEILGGKTKGDFKKVFWTGSDKLGKGASEFRRRTKPTREMISDPTTRALPSPPPIEVPFFAEVVQRADGRREVVGAVLKQS